MMSFNYSNIPVEGGLTSVKCVPVRDKLTYEITKFEWDQAPDNFKCVDSITIALGGIDENFSYLNDVEIIAPNMKCHNEKLPAYPIKVGNTTWGVTQISIIWAGHNPTSCLRK